MKLPPNDGIAFASRIKFVSHEHFQSRTASEVRDWTNPDYIGEPHNQAIVGTKGLTEDIFCCNAGGITNYNNRKVALFHFKPNAANNFHSTAKPMFLNAVEKLGEAKTRMSGFIIGGKSKAVAGQQSNNGQKLSDKIMDLFKKELKIPFTAFLRQKTIEGNTNVFYSSAEDTWYVDALANNKGPALGLRFFINDPENKTSQIETAQDIKSTFEFIKIADTDEVFIEERKVDKLSLYPGFTRIDGGYLFEYDLEVSTHESTPFTLIRTNPKSTNLSLGEKGSDKSILWVDTEDKEAVESVLENIDRIKQSILFTEIEKVQYAGTQKLPGFHKTRQKSGKLDVYEKQLEPESVKGHFSLIS